MDEEKKGPQQPSVTDSWRIFRILAEFVDGFETMTSLGPSVSMFGSAKLTLTDPYYTLAMDVASEITKRGFAIITGGGPGLMEAANRGAQSSGGSSCGLGIDLPNESKLNLFVDPQWSLHFRYFFVRKVMFIRYAQGGVFLPGGYGTLDELFEALTLIQTRKIVPFPIYLVGKEYWSGLIDWIRNTMLSRHCLEVNDLELFKITDDPIEVAEGIAAHYRCHQSQCNF